jgi:hypothetical protein
MTDRTSPVRRHTRFPVRWRVVYGCEEFLCEGTVLDVTQIGWRVAGPMPVQPGMRLTLHLWPEDKSGPLRVERATVLWVKGWEFALDVPHLTPDDYAWITQFLDQKLSRWLLRNPQPHRVSCATGVDPSDISNERSTTSEWDVRSIREAVMQRCAMLDGGTRVEGGYQSAFQRVRRDSERILNGMQALYRLANQDAILKN